MPFFVGMLTIGTPPGTVNLAASGANAAIPPAQNFQVLQKEIQWLTGQILNLSSEPVTVQFTGFGGKGLTKFTLQAFEGIKFRNLQTEYIGFVSANAAQVEVLAMKWEANPNLNPVELPNVEIETLFSAPQTAGIADASVYDRTTISSATTTTVATPASGNTITAFKVTIAVDGADIVDLFWTDSTPANSRFIGRVQFGGQGSYTFDLDGLRNPHGADGLLRVTTSTAATCTVDVVSSEA